MHFVVGGAFNGKAKWVKQQYERQRNECDWRSAYHSSFTKERFEDVASFSRCTVLEGMEQYIRAHLSQSESLDTIRAHFQQQLQIWLAWEKAEKGRILVIIGNDLSKGVVPIERKDRNWRDLTGWCYQDMTAEANRVDWIWYGIGKRLK